LVAKADAQMKDVLPAPPIAERSFPQSDQIWLFAEIYDNAGDTPHSVTIGTTVTNESDKRDRCAAGERPGSVARHQGMGAKECRDEVESQSLLRRRASR
jgi:hypothetical protein